MVLCVGIRSRTAKNRWSSESTPIHVDGSDSTGSIDTIDMCRRERIFPSSWNRCTLRAILNGVNSPERTEKWTFHALLHFFPFKTGTAELMNAFNPNERARNRTDSASFWL